MCGELELEKPQIVYRSDSFSTKTMCAMYSTSENILYLKNKEVSLDTFFFIAHELRHAWQWKVKKEMYFKDYDSVDNLGIEKYNLQIAEIDANAYAAVLIEDLFGYRPLWEGMPRSVVEEIKKYIDKIWNVL